MLLRDRDHRGRLPRAIVLTPTRELAKQVEDEFARFTGPLRTQSIYGGVSYELQVSDNYSPLRVLYVFFAVFLYFESSTTDLFEHYGRCELILMRCRSEVFAEVSILSWERPDESWITSSGGRST